MDQLQFVIAQGSTPRIELLLAFEFPDSGGKAFVTFSQGGVNVLEYGLNGTATPAIAGTGQLTVDSSDRSMLVLAMTQADTLSLKPGDVELQVRIKTTDGVDTFADTYEPLIGAVLKAKKGGVIS